MFKKKLRIAIPVALLLVMSLVATISAAPTTAINLCVTVQDLRPVDSTEEISYELRTINTQSVLHSGSGDAIVEETVAATATEPAMGDEACFEAQGFPGDVYDLWVKGDDTLSVLVEDYTYPATSNDAEADLTAEVTLTEGDSNNQDDGVDSVDFGIFGTSWLGTNDAADYNEDGIVDSVDFGRFGLNWLAGVTPPVTTSSRSALAKSAPTAYGVSLGTPVVSGGTISIPVVYTSAGPSEPIRTAQIDVAGIGLASTAISLQGVNSYNPQFPCGVNQTESDTCIVFSNFFANTGGTVTVANIVFDEPTCSGERIAIALLETAGSIGTSGTSADGIAATIASGSDINTGTSICPLSVGMSSMAAGAGQTSFGATITILITTMALAIGTMKLAKLD